MRNFSDVIITSEGPPNIFAVATPLTYEVTLRCTVLFLMWRTPLRYKDGKAHRPRLYRQAYSYHNRGLQNTFDDIL